MARYAPSHLTAHALSTSIDGPSVGKKDERLLKEAAKVKRVKKVKLNMLYFSSQCKDLLFPRVAEKQQVSITTEEPAVPATPSRCQSRDRSNSQGARTPHQNLLAILNNATADGGVLSRQPVPPYNRGHSAFRSTPGVKRIEML